ncbi:MAG: DUF2934 domain-containing protein [Methylovulum sp.]|nr:DUF2934 domain-containing protein [Methylovulum sp.]
MLSNLIKDINRRQWIAEAAYFKAEARNFAPGKALDDWREAEMAYANMLISLYVEVLAEDGPITLVGLQQLAQLLEVEKTDDLLSEDELIRAIQQAAKHRPCFRAENDRLCEEQHCQWVKECRRLVSVWCR